VRSINRRSVQVGSLHCQVVDALPPDQKPQWLVVLCHGYGAPGDDLVPLGGEILSQSSLVADQTQFLFPAAPIDLGDQGMPGGRAWWNLDIFQLQMAVMMGRFREFRSQVPEGLDNARTLLTETIDQWRQSNGVSWDHVILGGFSQGSMLATDVTLHLEENPSGLVIFSGTLLNAEEWRLLAKKHRGLTVVQSHGTDDPLLPHYAAEDLKDLLNDAGANVEFITFRGGHGIPPAALERTIHLLNRRIMDH